MYGLYEELVTHMCDLDSSVHCMDCAKVRGCVRSPAIKIRSVPGVQGPGITEAIRGAREYRERMGQLGSM